MPIQYLLADLLAETDDAIAVLLVDDRGETVELASVSPAADDVKLTGAYLALYLRRLEDSALDEAVGAPKRMHIGGSELHLHVEALPEGYSLALLQRSPAVVGRVRRQLTAAAELLRRELFP